MFSLVKKQLNEAWTILNGFQGNAKPCILTEPMFGIPYNLYIPYASLYMVALGCSDTQVGIVISVGLIFQMIFSLIGGYITDKLGRKKTTIIFDLIAWSIPALIWAFAQNFYYFLIAAMINSIVRIVYTSWSCLLIEDTRPEKRVHIYSWIKVAGILAGFFAPLAGIMVNKYSIIPAMRGLYLFAFVSMTSMFLIRNHFTQETEMGKKKIKETKNFRFQENVTRYKEVTLHLIKSPYTIIAFFLAVLNNIQLILRKTFLSILLNKGLGISQGLIAVFPAITSIIMLIFFILVMPKLGRRNSKKPLFWGLIISFISQLFLILAPTENIAVILTMVVFSTITGAVGMAIVYPFVQSILANAIDDENRAKIMSILFAILLAISAPFGYIGGLLSSISEKLPFVLNSITFIISAILVTILIKMEKNKNKAPSENVSI